MTKLKNGEYALKDIVDLNKISSNNINLGEYEGEDVILKKGKYGLYITYKGKNSSISHIKKKMEKVDLKDVLDVLKGKKTSNPNILKVIKSFQALSCKTLLSFPYWALKITMQGYQKS